MKKIISYFVCAFSVITSMLVADAPFSQSIKLGTYLYDTQLPYGPPKQTLRIEQNEEGYKITRNTNVKAIYTRGRLFQSFPFNRYESGIGTFKNGIFTFEETYVGDWGSNAIFKRSYTLMPDSSLQGTWEVAEYDPYDDEIYYSNGTEKLTWISH